MFTVVEVDVSSEESLNSKNNLSWGLCPSFYSKEKSDTFRVQKYFFNVISSFMERTGLTEHKGLRFFNIPIWERIINNDIREYYLCGKLIKKECLGDIFYRKYLRRLNLEYDDIYFLSANSGEIYLFFAYLAKAFLSKNGTKNPLFIATKRYHIDLIKMYQPHAQYILIDGYKNYIRGNVVDVNGHRCFNIFSSQHFFNFEQDLKGNEAGRVHYFSNIMSTLSLSTEDFSVPDFSITQDVMCSVAQKASQNHLDLNNFIFVAPEAQSCKCLSQTFWTNLASALKKLGFDVFLNILDKKNSINSCKSFDLSYQEAFYLASRAKAVVSLRSGLTEFLLPLKGVNITIYTKFRTSSWQNCAVQKIMEGYSMLKLPFVESELISELNAEQYASEAELLNKVLSELDLKIRKGEKV